VIENDTPHFLNDNSFLSFKNDLGIYAKLEVFTFDKCKYHPIGRRHSFPI